MKWACGLGSSQKTRRGVHRLFGGAGNLPVLRAPLAPLRVPAAGKKRWAFRAEQDERSAPWTAGAHRSPHQPCPAFVHTVKACCTTVLHGGGVSQPLPRCGRFAGAGFHTGGEGVRHDTAEDRRDRNAAARRSATSRQGMSGCGTCSVGAAGPIQLVPCAKSNAARF